MLIWLFSLPHAFTHLHCSGASLESFAPFLELTPLVQAWMDDNTQLLKQVRIQHGHLL
jgi:hypothetical protein